MLKDLKNTIRQSAIYGLSRIATKFVSFILLPIYSINFSIAEYGIISRIETLWQILFAIFLFGLESGVIKWYSKIKKEDEKKRFLFSITFFLFVINLFSTAFLYFSSGLFSVLIFKTEEYSNLIFYASLIASMETFVFLMFLLLRIKEKAFLYTLLSVLIAILNLGIQVYYIFYTEKKLEGVFIAKIISPAIILLILLPYFVRFLKPGFDFKNLKELIIYSFPIMLASLFGTMLNQSDRYILGYLGTSTDVGLYSLAYNICGLLNFFVIAPFALAFSIISWNKLKSENAVRFFTKNITYLFFVITYLALALSLATPNLIKVFAFNKDYWKAKDIVPWIAIAMPFYGVSIISFFSFYVTGKTFYVLYFTIASLIINLVLNFIFIPAFSFYGAALSNFISFFLLCYLCYVFSKKNYFFEYEWYKLFLMVGVYIILIFPFFYFQMNDLSFMNVILKLAALISFPVILYFLNFYESVEVENLKGFFNKYLNPNFKSK